MLTLLKNGWQLYLNVSKSYQIKNQWELVLRGLSPFITFTIFRKIMKNSSNATHQRPR